VKKDELGELIGSLRMMSEAMSYAVENWPEWLGVGDGHMEIPEHMWNEVFPPQSLEEVYAGLVNLVAHLEVEVDTYVPSVLEVTRAAAVFESYCPHDQAEDDWEPSDIAEFEEATKVLKVARAATKAESDAEFDTTMTHLKGVMRKAHGLPQ